VHTLNDNGQTHVTIRSDIVSRCVLFNARSLKNKLCDLHALLDGVVDEYSMLFITESWLNSTVTDGMIDCSGKYNVYRKDRVNGVSGGVLGLISKKLNSYSVAIPEIFCNIEVVAVNVVTAVGSLRFITIYRPPKFNQLGREYMTKLCEC